MVLIAPSSEKGWGLVYQDDKGGLQEATGWPNWKVNALQTAATPKMGTPLSINGLGPDSVCGSSPNHSTKLLIPIQNYELYFINDKNEVIQRTGSAEVKVGSDDMDIHPNSALATFFDKQTDFRRIIFQQADGNIRVCSNNLDLKLPWKLEPSTDWAATPGAGIASYITLQAVMVAFQAPDGKIVVHESSNMGMDWSKETPLSATP
jgi:hypothetical protein